jgi:small nuclear ribonucleoprotein
MDRNPAEERLLYAALDRAAREPPGRFSSMMKPLQVLQSALGKPVAVELRAHAEFRGTLDGYDPHMNLVLKQATEFFEGRTVGEYPTAIVRGDSVIYISEVDAQAAKR